MNNAGRKVPPGGIVFETGRLVIRAARLEDVPVYLALWTNPAIMKYMGFPFRNRREAAAPVLGPQVRRGSEAGTG
jgi:RimJ/RimL family protein N-acetyltransferase